MLVMGWLGGLEGHVMGLTRFVGFTAGGCLDAIIGGSQSAAIVLAEGFKVTGGRRGVGAGGLLECEYMDSRLRLVMGMGESTYQAIRGPRTPLGRTRCSGSRSHKNRGKCCNCRVFHILGFQSKLKTEVGKCRRDEKRWMQVDKASIYMF